MNPLAKWRLFHMFKAGGGGGGGGFELPYFYNFDDETVGQPPADWIDNGAGFAPIVANSLVGQNSYNPNRKMLHNRNDAGNYCDTMFVLPGSLPQSFRMAWWTNCESTDGEDAHRITLHDSASGASKNMWFHNGFSYVNNDRICLTRENGADNIWSLTEPNLTSPSGWRWKRITIEYDHTTKDSMSQIYYMDSPATQGYNRTIDFSSETQWAPEGIDTVRIWHGARSSQYREEIYTIGFWFGALTDDWPAVVMP